MSALVIQMMDSNGGLPECWFYCRDGWALEGECLLYGEEAGPEAAKLLELQERALRGPNLIVAAVRRLEKRRTVSPEEAFAALESRGLG